VWETTQREMSENMAMRMGKTYGMCQEIARVASESACVVNVVGYDWRQCISLNGAIKGILNGKSGTVVIETGETYVRTKNGSTIRFYPANHFFSHINSVDDGLTCAPKLFVDHFVDEMAIGRMARRATDG